MGRGRSKNTSQQNSGGGNGGTPSGVSYDDFMKMDDAQKYQTMIDIIGDSNIKVPAYLDSSATSKVMYALGMANKPTVVSDDQLEAMPGKDLYRTVYEGDNMPPPSSADILDQIRTGDYTQLSGSGGSFHGRALYFARDDFWDSATYGTGRQNPMVMRAKINPNAKLVRETNLVSQMKNDSTWNSQFSSSATDGIALYAIAHGIDGWYMGNYTMMINRGVLTASSKNKNIYDSGGSFIPSSWGVASDAN